MLCHYNIENAGAKATAAQDIVKMIKQYGSKIDGVGLQSHFIVGSTPSQAAQTATMNAFVALGVEVAVTELDIRTSTPESSSALIQQARDYASTISACNSVAKCVGVTIWDYTDKYSWIPSTFSGQGAALPWDENLTKKTDVYDAILSAWGSAPSETVSTSSTMAAPSSAAATATAAAGGSIARWNQCGGNGWTGSGSCVSGTVCSRLNDYYSQCL